MAHDTSISNGVKTNMEKRFTFPPSKGVLPTTTKVVTTYKKLAAILHPRWEGMQKEGLIGECAQFDLHPPRSGG
jgi:hypothetical protein